MTAHEHNFSIISNKGTIKIPFFQRAYVWDEDQWAKLLNDLFDSYDQNYTHFLGSIILKSYDTSTTLLIDGQQRATTFSILLRVLGEQLSILEKDKELNTCLFAQDHDYNDIPRIEHSRIDRRVFSAIILGELELIEDSSKKSSIYKCYKYFSKRIAEYKESVDEDTLKKFLRKILTDKLFVLVDINKDEDAQRIFDSINTSGLPLANFDIVKNDIFSHFENEETSEKVYDEYWRPVFEKDEETKEFWDEEVLTGREKNIRSDVFLHNFTIIEQILNPSTDSLSKITETYKKYIKNKTESELIEFIKKFVEYAKVFTELPFFYNEEEYVYSDTMKRFLQISHALQLSTLTPIALFIEIQYQQKKLSKQEYCDSLRLLEKYFIRRALIKLDTSGYNKTIFNLIDKLSNSNNIYVSLKEFLDTLKSDTDRFPTEKEIQNLSFEEFDTKLAKLLLFWIELKKRQIDKEYSDGKEPLKYNFQLEHLMPRAWEQYWKLPVIDCTLDVLDDKLQNEHNVSNSIYDMGDYEFIEELNKLGYVGEQINSDWGTRKRKINELGNFTILNGKLNNSLKNYEWQRKLNGEGNKKGIKYYSTLSLNRELCVLSEWTEETISKRTEELKKHIVSIW